MKKTYRVKNKKKQVHEFRPVANVAEYLDALREYSDRTIFAWKEHGEAHELTYGELLENVRCLALALTATYGENAHRVIGIIGETSANWIISYLAILSSGNVALPLDKELAHEELSKFLAVADAAGIVYSATFNDVMPEIADGHPTLTNLFPMAPAENTPAAVGNAVVVSYDRMLRIGLDSDREFIPDTDTERMAQILFTSGTTGSSKCVMLCQRNIFSVVTSACTQVYFCKEDVLVSVLPLHHTYELACTLAATNFGAKICINDSIRHALKNFKEYQPTGLVLVPLFVTTMYKKIQSEAKRSGKDKILAVGTKVASKLSLAGIDLSDKIFKDVREAFGGRLHKIICGGAALSPELIATFEAFGISIYEGYGITECSPLVAVTPYWKRKPGTVGPAVPCCEIRIDGVQENDKGYISGEIQVRGENVMLGYMNNDEANAEAFTDDGWFRTGDIGYMDKDGYLTITGREKSVIVLDNGKNVFPEEIEEYLERIDTIAESVIVGRAEETTGETKLVAVIFPSYEKYPDLTESDLRAEIQKSIAALNKKLPSFKQIHKLEFRKTEFEKTSSRKIKRHLVK
ncbi:MAG: AMP-binding protein [Clostridia bacterium]|nr:AMP-binding protein [Clostridia bacterium]